MDNLSEIRSVSFRQAELLSERVRILGILTVLVVAALIGTLRVLVVRNPAETQFFFCSLVLAVGMVAYEWGMLSAVQRKIGAGQDFPSWVWRLNHSIEALFPTLLLLISTLNPIVGPYRALVAPVALVYFFFIILSTLRLDARHCCLAGLVSSGGYTFMIFFTRWLFPLAPQFFAQGTFLTYALLILFGGFIAGGVAREIRKHVIASLKEAETRRQMEQLERDMQTARGIQRGLLPAAPPKTPQFNIAGWNLPADATGGDYYDWQMLPDGRIVVSLADATGHGIGPALVMAVCRAYARAGFASSSSLRDVISHLNDLLVCDLPQDRFVTYVATLLDPARPQFEISSAGHGPLLLFRAGTGQFERIEAQGIPLGLFPGYPYDAPRTYELAQGDMLILLTDGFFEWTNPNDEEFGLERLQQSLLASREIPPSDVISRLYADVLQFAEGTRQADDLTAVIIQRNKRI
jgi:serine phosphatase RsbU (regulator of sigma subunit)